MPNFFNKNINNSNKIIGIVSAKGGVGKTTAAINIGAAAYDTFKKNVLILDGNLNTGNLGLNLGLVYHPVSLYKIIKDPVSILQNVHKHKSGLHVIPSSLVKENNNINPSELNKKLKAITAYDLILLDSAPGVGEDVQLVMKSSDMLLLVVTPDYPTIATAIKTVELAKKFNAKINGIILNKVRKKRYEPTKNYIEATLGLPIISVIPEDGAMQMAVAARMPITIYKKRSKAAISFKKLAAVLFGKKIKASLASKILEILKLR